MKKLLSICFLSILLGLLSFSVQAQNCSGFWIENLQPQTLTGIANAPSGNGTLVLDNVLNPAEVNHTDLYELHFCPCGLDDKTKVSVDWLLYRDGELVNENLSAYADFSIYTLYPELNVEGQCQQIAWLGGKVANNFGFCDQQEAETNALLALQNNINGVGPCTTPTNYPGALQSQYGIQPGSVVVNQITGETTNAMGLATLYSQAFDFFYMDFFAQTRTIVKITWKQVGNYSLVMRIRERVGGTDWNNAYWKKNADGTVSQVDYIGGHQSCCGRILAEDSIHYLVTGEFYKEVCENDPYHFGTIEDRCNKENIEQWFTTTTPDTFVMFGNYDSARCCHIAVDSVYRFHFYQRNTPDVTVQDSIVCQCTPLTPQDIVNMVGVDQEDLDLTFNHYLQWWGYGEADTVEIGTGTGSTYYLPAYMYYNNAYTQQIYTPEEVSTGHISSISFYHTFNPNAYAARPVDEHLKIYLSTTDKSSFSGSTDWVTGLSEANLVYDGVVTFGTDDAWYDIPFQNGFDYDGNDNLLVTIIGHNSQYGDGHNFGQTATPGAYMSVYKYRDGTTEYTNSNITTEGGSGSRANYRNNVRFGVRQLEWLDMPEVMPMDVEAANYEYIVRQVNEYANYKVLDGSEYDTITCVGEPDTFHIIIEPMYVELPENAKFCVADFTDTTVLTVVAERMDECSTITRWFAADEDGEADLSEVIFEGDTFNMNKTFLSDYFDFAANEDGEVVFFAAAYNANLECTGKILTPYVITFNQTPVLTATVTPDSLLCPGGEAVMQVNITNNPFLVNKPFTYHWTGVDSLTDVVPEYSTYFLTIPEDNSHDANNTQYLPDYVLYNYSYTQQLFTAEELASGPISKIGFYAATVANNTTSQNRKVSIFLSTTDKDNLASGWEIDEDNMTLVYNDIYHYTANAWNDFVLTTPFDYDPSQGNLVITIIDSTGDWNSSNYFYRTSTDQNAVMARYYYRDSAPFDVIPGVPGYTATYRDNIRFEFTGVTMVEGTVPSTIGADFVLEGTDEHNRVPVNNFYNYSYTQQIYTPDEVSDGMPGKITALAFDYAYASPTTVKNNVDIYLTTTDKESFADETDTISIAGLQPVYSGALNCTEGWNTFELTTPYEYDGVSNLALIVYDHSGDYNGYSYVFRTVSENSVEKSLIYYSDDDSTIEDIVSNGNADVVDYRSNITFTVMVPYAPAIDFKYSKGYKDLTASCHEAYESTVFVVDDNRCKSNVVTFNYETGDTIAPVVVPAAYTEIFNTCDSATLAEFAEEFAFASIDALDEYLKNVEEADSTFGAYDNCSLVAVSYVDEFIPAGEGCEISIKRTYTLMDSCYNVSNFTHTFIGHDQNAPEFAIDRPMRLLPVPAGEDCKYNAPSLATMKNMIDPFVTDECTNHEYLMDSIQFFWENTNLNPADAQNIFEVENHLTISAITRDICGNWTDTTVIFFLDRPDTLFIEEDAWAPVILCSNDTAIVTFDPATIHFDEIVGPYYPLTYTWSEQSGRPVTFTNQGGLVTGVRFNDGAGDYYIIMTVTDANGCSAVSAARQIHVRTPLGVSIEPVVKNGATEPYCPTYGNLTVKAVVTKEAGVQVNSYEWIGESVNEASTVDTSWITFIPVACDTIYTATVNIVDDRGCTATDTRSFATEAKAPVFNHGLDDVYVTISDSCTLNVPDFKNAITNALISDDCYYFSEITAKEWWYKQVPSADSVFTEDSLLVTITVTNPCHKSATTTLYVRKPANYPTVSINPQSIEACYEDLVTPGNNDNMFTATGSYLGNNPSYVWTVDGDIEEGDIVGYNNVLAFPINADIWTPENEEITYNFTITATNNENGCVASATAPVTVHYQGDPVHLRVWDNTMCINGHYNGVIAVDTIPFNYIVTLEGLNVAYGPVVKISDVPYHQTTDWNTIIFDSLQAGYYRVYVENLFGCVMTADTFLINKNLQFDDVEYTVTPMTTCNGNGTVTITPAYGFTYELEKDNLEYVGSGLTYTGLASGYYWIKQTQTSTFCKDSTYIFIPDETVNEVITADTTPLTNCNANNGTIVAHSDVTNMKYRLMKKNATGAGYSVYTPTTGSAANKHNGYYYQTSANFNTLGAGQYIVVGYNPSTGCCGYDTVEIRDARVNPVIETITTPNNYCSNTSGTYNGTLTVTPASDYQLTLKWKSSGSAYNQTQTTTTAGYYAGLYPGNMRQYQLTAKNTTTNCTTTVSNIRIANDLYYPTVTTDSTIMNTVCDPTVNPYNGGVVLNVTADVNGHDGVEADSCDYTINMFDSANDGWQSNTLRFTQNDESITISFTTGGEKHETVRLASGVETEIRFGGGSWKSETSFEILDPAGNIVWSKSRYDAEISNDSYTYNYHEFTPSCYEPVEAYPTFLTYVKPYTVNINGVNKGTFSDTTATVMGYQEGTYTAQVVSSYYCKSNVDTFKIVKETVPAMTLTSTPDHFCAPTFEKPGNGTVVIINPLADETHTYTYKFFDAFDNEMNVPYDLPMTYTKYWLEHGAYKVVSYEVNTGCKDSANTVVDWQKYTVDFTYSNTDDEFCSNELGNGTITVTNAWISNPDLTTGFIYKLNDGAYQTSNVFSGLNTGAYSITVKDTLSACVANAQTVTIDNHTCAPIIDSIFDNISGRANEYHYCYGTEGVILTGVAHDTCDNTPLEYYWSAPCADPTESFTSTIGVQTDHIVVGGCNYILTVTNPLTECTSTKTVKVHVHPNPDLYLTINGQTASTTHYNEFCENTTLNITVHNLNQEALDIESIQWTQGKIASGVQTITVNGTQFDEDVVTFCVRAANIYGCMSGIISIPVKFYREPHMTVVDTACISYNVPGTNRVITNPTNVYPYTTTFDQVYYRTRPLCDSVVTYTITLINAPVIDPYVAPAAFCEDDNKTLADYSNFSINWNGAQGTTKWMAAVKNTNNYIQVPTTTALTYDYVTTHDIKFVATNRCNYTEAPMVFTVYKKPVINTFNLNNPYCASNYYNFTATVSSYGTQATAKLYIEGNNTPLATANFNGLNQTVTFNNIKTPKAYNTKNLILEVVNTNDYCDAVTASRQLRVDTTEFTVSNTNIYCVGDSLRISDFTGLVPSDYNTVVLKHEVDLLPDPTINLPYYLGNRSLNDEGVYFIVSNNCYTNIRSNVVTLTVNDKPSVADIANINVCYDDFELTVPNIQTNGSAILPNGQGWLYKINGAYVTTNTANIKEFAVDTMIEAAYFATNSCGSDTTKFTVLVNNKPKVTVSASSMCPNASLLSTITTTVNYHNIGGQGNTSYFVAKNANSRVVYQNLNNLKWDDLANFTSLWYVAENGCGRDSAQVVINVLTFNETAPTFKQACDGNTLSAFKATDPAWTGSAGCIAETYQIKINNTISNATLNTEINAADAPQVRYMWVTGCYDTVYSNFVTLTVNKVPELDLTDVAGVCDGSTIDPTTAISSVTYYGYEDLYDTAYTVNGQAVNAETVYTFDDNGKYLVVSLTGNNQTCGNVVDSVMITIYEIPDPTITGPVRVCNNTEVTFEAEAGFQSYVFSINGEVKPAQTSNLYNYTVTADGVERTYASVTVYDGHCYGTSTEPTSVIVTNQPRFRFFNADNTENLEHAYTVNNGGGLDYGWEIGTDCGAEDILVYVEYDIYFNGQIIPNNAVGEYFYTSTVTGLDQLTYPYVNTNTITWLNGDQSQHDPVTSLHNCSVANPLDPQTRNHFPNFNLGLTNNNAYDDLWMHFIGDRRVTSTLVPFRLDGEYKVVYRLYATDYPTDFNHIYYDTCSHMGGAYQGQSWHIGGHNAAFGNITLLVVDSITINVTNTPVSTDPEVVVVPETAPELSVEDNVIVTPEMEVWPNPAPAITTTFKARVHHMNGEATVSIVSLTGKQIFNGQMNIDDDNYYFEASVNNLSVGTYVMTVRTADAVISKKVIVTR